VLLGDKLLVGNLQYYYKRHGIEDFVKHLVGAPSWSPLSEISFSFTWSRFATRPLASDTCCFPVLKFYLQANSRMFKVAVYSSM